MLCVNCHVCAMINSMYGSATGQRHRLQENQVSARCHKGENAEVAFAGAGIALYGEQGRGESYQAHITSYDYDCMVSEAGQYGQPGIGGPNKYQVSPFFIGALS